MTARKAGRTETCSRGEANIRIAQAGKFLEVAELVATEAEVEESASVAASLAVLAGIAASDAACCVALGRRSSKSSLKAHMPPGHSGVCWQ